MTLSDFHSACCSSIASTGSDNELYAIASDNGRRAAGTACESFMRHLKDLPPVPCGASSRQWKAANDARVSALRQAVMQDVADQNEISRFKLGIYLAAGAIVFALGGATAIILVAAEAALGYCLEEYIEDHENVKKVAEGLP